MSWAITKQSTRSLFFALAVISLAVVGLWFGVQNNTVEANTKSTSNAVPAATFAGTGVGPIPDATATCQTAQGVPLNVTFNVTGITGSVSNVVVSATVAHTWVGDVTATLIAPNGASHIVFARTGSSAANVSGDSTNLGGAYVFSDAANAPPSGGWWQEAAARTDTQVMTVGTYRSTSPGPGTTGTATSINPAFTGVTNANGTWTLRFTDGCPLDTGSVSAATLTVEGATARDANVDFDGDGKTDFVVTRATANPLTEAAASADGKIRQMVDSRMETKTRLRQTEKSDKSDNLIAPPIYWYTTFNGSGATGVGQLGDAETDILTPEDFDGDGKDDLAVWTPGAPSVAGFKILQSSTNTVVAQAFGQDGDIPTVVGDYDGDNKADAAVFRCPPSADGQCYFFYRGTSNNPSGSVTYVPWGFGVDGDFFPYVGDFDGDGKNDFCLQRAIPTSTSDGQFILLRSSDLGSEFINWGFSDDFLVPGDYDGDGRTDFCVRRTVGSAREHWILYRTGTSAYAQWGIESDQSAPGDYDGDGKTDLAIWRGSATPGQSQFWVLNSSNGSVTNYVWGQCGTNCDIAAAGWLVF